MCSPVASRLSSRHAECFLCGATDSFSDTCCCAWTPVWGKSYFRLIFDIRYLIYLSAAIFIMSVKRNIIIIFIFIGGVALCPQSHDPLGKCRDNWVQPGRLKIELTPRAADTYTHTYRHTHTHTHTHTLLCEINGRPHTNTSPGNPTHIHIHTHKHKHTHTHTHCSLKLTGDHTQTPAPHIHIYTYTNMYTYTLLLSL